MKVRIAACAMAMLGSSVQAQAENDAGASSQASPWLAVPMVSSNPKVGTSAGGMTGYLFKLDPESTSSMVGMGGTFSTTDSYGLGVFLRTFWDQDRKRLTVFGGGGKINNDYEDFLGSGLSAQTTDSLRAFQLKYMQQVQGDWYAGFQATYTNYLIFSENGSVNDYLNLLGLTGFDSVGVGLVGMYDSRNNKNTPTSGIKFQVDNFAYRESLGGEESFDVYKAKFRHYLPQKNGHVLAYRVDGRWTDDASSGAYSSVDLRGYTQGQYLSPHASLVEVEQRWRLRERFGVNLFAGLACLYGGGNSCTDSDNLYPSVGVGGQFLINKAEQMSMSFDFAVGKEGNNGLYMRFGQAF